MTNKIQALQEHDLPVRAVPHLIEPRACAIVVLYYPDTGFLSRLHKIQKQFDFVVLIDNTPDRAEFEPTDSSVKMLRNCRNLGIAKALNQGIAIAFEKGYEWVATFDQDTELLPGYLDSVASVVAEHSASPVLIGVNYLDRSTNQLTHTVPADAGAFFPRLTLITSGTFMPVGFTQAIGGFREEFFIDSVDHEFCLRARKNGAAILMIAQPYMRHRIGLDGARLFGWLLSMQHPPLRRYYIARNALITIRDNFWNHPRWSFRQIARIVGEAISIIVIESNKFAKLRALVKGVYHGLIGRTGAYEEL